MLPVYVICKNSDGAFICPDDDSTEIKTKHLPTFDPFAGNCKTDEQKEEIDNSVKSVIYGGNISQEQQVVKNDTDRERCSVNEVQQTEVKSIAKKQGFEHEKEDIISSNCANRALQLPTHIEGNPTKNGLKPQHQNNSVAHAVKKLKLNCRMMQTFFAESLFEHKFQRKTFRLLEEKDGSPLIQLFHSKLDICDVPEMTEGNLYDFFHKGKFLITLDVFQQIELLEKQILKLTSHGVLHYLWPTDLSKSFSRLMMSIFVFLNYFFH